MKNEGTPDRKLEQHTSDLITDSDIPSEKWVTALEEFRRRVVKDIFGRITLRKLNEQLFASNGGMTIPRRAEGPAKDLYEEQGLFHFAQRVCLLSESQSSREFLGLTRKGKWVKGHALVKGNNWHIAETVHIESPSTTKAFPGIGGIQMADIPGLLCASIQEAIAERSRAYYELQAKFSPINSFAYVARIKYGA